MGMGIPPYLSQAPSFIDDLMYVKAQKKNKSIVCLFDQLKMATPIRQLAAAAYMWMPFGRGALNFIKKIFKMRNCISYFKNRSTHRSVCLFLWVFYLSLCYCLLLFPSILLSVCLSSCVLAACHLFAPIAVRALRALLLLSVLLPSSSSFATSLGALFANCPPSHSPSLPSLCPFCRQHWHVCLVVYWQEMQLIKLTWAGNSSSSSSIESATSAALFKLFQFAVRL